MLLQTNLDQRCKRLGKVLFSDTPASYFYRPPSPAATE